MCIFIIVLCVLCFDVLILVLVFVVGYYGFVLGEVFIEDFVVGVIFFVDFVVCWEGEV